MSDSKADYDQWHASLEVDEQADAPWHHSLRRFMPEKLDDASLLEIGCGRGGFSAWLGENRPAARHVAADFSDVAVEKATAFFKKRGLEQIECRIEDIERMSFSDQEFDIVVSSETIEHVPHPQRAIFECSRVLKPGGILYLTTPNYLGTMGLYRAYMRVTRRRFTEGGQPINHFMLFFRTLLWLKAAGFTVKKSGSVGHYLPFPGREPIRYESLDRFGILTKCFGLHSFYIAQKESATT